MPVERLTADELPRDVSECLHRQWLLSSPDFARLWRAIGGIERFWALTDHGGVLAVLPGVEFRRFPLTRFQSMPDGLYSRCIHVSSNAVEKTSAVAAILSAVSRAGYARVYLNDYDGVLSMSNVFKMERRSTLIAPVSDSSWMPPDKTLQSEIRKAEREGVVVEQFHADCHMDAFWSLVEETESRHHRSPKYPRIFFESLADLAERDQRIRWLVALHHGEMAASHVYFVLGDTLLHWQSYSARKPSFLKANQYLLFTATRQQAAEGVRFLNLGASPVDAVGLAAFKEKWGSAPHAYTCLAARSWLGRIL